ncbi:hypothetical protein BGZ63DRAFT_369198 [Mariannaea sp. PMI_226]|nr:hypothetical protein BGZ63DRAFT_369198 [Mariannaea sp. PMI_226]
MPLKSRDMADQALTAEQGMELGRAIMSMSAEQSDMLMQALEAVQATGPLGKQIANQVVRLPVVGAMFKGGHAMKRAEAMTADTSADLLGSVLGLVQMILGLLGGLLGGLTGGGKGKGGGSLPDLGGLLGGKGKGGSLPDIGALLGGGKGGALPDLGGVLGGVTGGGKGGDKPKII